MLEFTGILRNSTEFFACQPGQENQTHTDIQMLGIAGPRYSAANVSGSNEVIGRIKGKSADL